MFPLDCLVAAALLAAPPGGDEPTSLGLLYAELTPHLHRLAIAEEILDAREVRYLFARPEDFRADVSLLRQRGRDLRGAPPLSDCLRFPPRPVVGELLLFNRNYREHLERCRVAGTTPDPQYDEMLREVDRLYQIWDGIRDCRCEYLYVAVRRQALLKVRDAIGEDAFYRGDFPPHVPIWRFKRID